MAEIKREFFCEGFSVGTRETPIVTGTVSSGEGEDLKVVVELNLEESALLRSALRRVTTRIETE